MILSATEISKAYGRREVLKRVSLHCARGEICGLIGPNGAGKSTLFRILLGLVRQDSGTLSMPSESPKPLGGIIEKPALYGYLSAYENLRVFARVQRLPFYTSEYRKMMMQVGLDPERRDPVRNYSMGMKQRLGLSVALLNQPECVILDEPFSGLDPIGIRSLQEKVRGLAREQDISILISSHNLSELGDLCDRLYVINKGEIVRSGPAHEILQAAARGYLIYGSGLEGSAILKESGAQFRRGSALIRTTETPIDGVLKSLTQEEGVSISGCIPQTDLRALFERELP